MWRVDACSRKYVRLYLVARRFQISAHFVEYQSVRPINKAANVFAHDPTRLDSVNDSKHFRPEVSRIVFSLSFTGLGEGLAGESAGNNVNCAGEWGGVECADVVMAMRDVWEVFAEDALTPRVYFDLEYVFPACPLGGEVKASDAGEEGAVCHAFITFVALYLP